MNISKKPSRPKTAFGQVVSELGQRFFTHDVGRDSAALSYYFLFAIFPLLILISLLVGLLHVNIESTSALLSQVIPADVVGVIENYLSYVSGLRSPKMLWFCMIFSIWFPMRAINCLTHSIRKAFGHGNPDSPLKNQFFLFLAALVLILVISFSLSLIVIGRRVLEFAARFITLSKGFITVWNYGRFAVLFVIILLSISAIYFLAVGRRMPWKDVLPGVLFSVVAWTLFSVIFSYYVEHFGNYSILYGSIATIVVVLLWLFMTSTVLVLGAELSAVLTQRRHDKDSSREVNT